VDADRVLHAPSGIILDAVRLAASDCETDPDSQWLLGNDGHGDCDRDSEFDSDGNGDLEFDDDGEIDSDEELE
jgi:hypothetical protein